MTEIIPRGLTGPPIPTSLVIIGIKSIIIGLGWVGVGCGLGREGLVGEDGGGGGGDWISGVVWLTMCAVADTRGLTRTLVMGVLVPLLWVGIWLVCSCGGCGGVGGLWLLWG